MRGSLCGVTLDELIDAAAARIRRYTPVEAAAADAVLVDIRSQDARERDGAIPGAHHVPRTVLEWRLASDAWRNEELDGRRLILVCDHGYSSILAAATLVELGRDAGDLAGGFEAWRDAGLPVTEARTHRGLPGMGPPD
jgi:rhodanese-related sulfurtransferase